MIIETKKGTFGWHSNLAFCQILPKDVFFYFFTRNTISLYTVCTLHNAHTLCTLAKKPI